MDDLQKKFSNKAIAHLLRSVATVYLLKGVNRFRTIAYENAADAVEHLTRELRDIWQDNKLYDVPGIGPSIGSHLDEYFKAGRSKHFDSILKKIPSAVYQLMKIPTVGPKKAYKLVTSLKLINDRTAVEDLKKACLAGKVAKLETFGEKSQQDILEAINLFEKRSTKTERMPLPYAFSLAKELTEYIKQFPSVKRVDALGSLRRMVATIGDIDIAVVVSDKKTHDLIQHFLKFAKLIRIDNAGEKKASIIVRPNVRVDLRVEEEKSYGSMLQYFTGSKAHNINLREYALRKGLSLSEYGIKSIKKVPSSMFQVPSKSKDPIFNKQTELFEFKNEVNFYKFLGLQYIPPEIREGTDEIELAKMQKIPRLIETKEIKGDLHIHSSYNLKPSHDFGKNSYKEILDHAEKLHYEYVGFADHNPKIGDLSEKEVIEIMRLRNYEINKIRKLNMKVKCFVGLEVDILPSGKIALPEKAIEYVDYLIISVHSAFNLDIKTMTARVMKALDYPKIKILGHPTGRLLGRREGFELEWSRIFDFCKKKNIAIEINSWPERLDLPDTLVREGLKYGLKYTINTDAHANNELDGVFYGVAVARRGWCKKSDIINTFSFRKFEEWLYG
ncbi:hypothetical protein HY357_02485 [Candidatus Roizmanbacteria bacterium]|nr:hypothetical protein [Candidatus Roizmanbacteria bacterium]